MHYTATVRTNPLAAGVQHFFLDDDEPPAAGSRPHRIATLSGPQERDLRRTVEQIVDAVPLAPLLDDPVSQMVEQLPNIVEFFAAQLPVVAEPVIEVPKILPHDFPPRRLCRDTQLAEQLVEVPTIVSFSLLKFIMEQNVGIPVPGRGGGISGLQGYLPGQSSTALPSLERISERIVEQNVEFPVGGGLQDFLPGQSTSASSSSPAGVRGSADGPVEGFFFRTFTQIKKSSKLGSHSGSELLPESSPSTLAAHVDALSGVELLAKFQQLSDQVVDMGRVAGHARKGFSSDIDWLYRLITDARIRFQQLEAWADEVTGEDDGPG